jgi:hypothetical protein
MPEVELRVYPP